MTSNKTSVVNKVPLKNEIDKAKTISFKKMELRIDNVNYWPLKELAEKSGLSSNKLINIAVKRLIQDYMKEGI